MGDTTTLRNLGLESDDEDEEDAPRTQEPSAGSSPLRPPPSSPDKRRAGGMTSEDGDEEEEEEPVVAERQPGGGVEATGLSSDEDSDDEEFRGDSGAGDGQSSQQQQQGEAADNIGGRLAEHGFSSDENGDEQLEGGAARRITRSRTVGDASAPHVETVPLVPRVPAKSRIVEVNITGLGVKLAEYHRDTVDVRSEQVERVPMHMRWRFKRGPQGNLLKDETGRPIRESNARLVKYPDGTMQLYVGAVRYNCTLSDVQTRFLVTSHGMADGRFLLEPVGGVHQNMTLAPESNAFTRTRRKRKADETGGQKRGLLKIETRHDPERERDKRIKARDEDEKRERKQNRRRGGGAAMSVGYLEDDEGVEYDSTNVNSLKASFRQQGRSTKTSSRARARDESEEDEDDDDEISDDDDEDEYVVRSNKKGGKDKQGDDDDDDDEEDEEEEAVVVKRGRRAADDDDDEEEEMNEEDG